MLDRVKARVAELRATRAFVAEPAALARVAEIMQAAGREREACAKPPHPGAHRAPNCGCGATGLPQGARRDLPGACRDRRRGAPPAGARAAAQAGAGVDGHARRLPRALVEQAVASAPRSFVLRGRAPDGSLDRELADGLSWYGTGPDCLYVDR